VDPITETNGIRYETGSIPTDEGRINYSIRPRSGPRLVLIPGSLNDRRVYSEVVKRLDHDVHLTIAEIRGHGGSWPPPRNGSIEQFAADAIAIMDHTKCRTCFIGGHSIGGMIALEVGRIAPERALGIISIEGWSKAEAQRLAFGDAKTNPMPEALLEKRMRLRKSVTKDWSEDQIASFGRIWRRWDGTQFLESTSLPVLEIYGDRGRERPGIHRLFIPKRDNIEVRWIDNASHSLPIEAPNRVAAAINDFLQRVGGATV
jgi:pimeloyl-ACP methyl ester carboxylesterase